MSADKSTFAAQLRPHVERLGAVECARLCGVTRRTIYHWLDGTGTPTHATTVGALTILRGRAKAKTPPRPAPTGTP